MRKIILLPILASLFLSYAAFAATPSNPLAFLSGFYVGGQVGYANLFYNKKWLTDKNGFNSVSSVDSRNYAGHIYLGYAFNDFWSVESSYLLLQDVIFNGINGSTEDQGMKQTMIDLSGKLTLPMHYVGLFIKGGGAYVHRSEITAGSVKYKANNKYVPIVGSGLNIYISNNVTLNAEFDYYLKTDDLEQTIFYGVGATYQFT